MIRLVAVLALAMLTGCASAPTRFYALTAPSPAPGMRGLAGPTIAVGPVAIPDALDRAQIVTRLPGGEVRVDEFARWAGPLRGELARVLADQLGALRPDARIAPADAAPPTPDYRLALDVRRFDLVPGEGGTLDVVWTLSAGGKAVHAARSVIAERADGPGLEALLAAQSRALERLAREIAPALPTAQPR